MVRSVVNATRFTRLGQAVALLALVSWSSVAHGEVAVGTSLEWLCAEADVIVVGHVVEVADLRGEGKNRGLVMLTVEVDDQLEGESEGSTIALGVRDIEPSDLQALEKSGASLLLFLRRTEQAFTHGGREVDLWPLRDADREQVLFDLDDGSGVLLSATTFTLLRDRDAILSACREVLARLEPFADREVRRHYLEVPIESEVHGALYAGSTCYLFVPDVLFPQARKEL